MKTNLTHRTPATKRTALRNQLSQSAAFALLALPLATQAAEDRKVNPLFDAVPFEKAWGLATLYKDANNPIIEEFKLRGRYHGQYWNLDAEQGNASDWEDRRSRFGFEARFLEKKVEVRLDFQSNDGFEDPYDGLVDAFIKWKPVKGLTFTAGKTRPMIAAYDWLESSITQPTFERSQIFNQLGVNRATSFITEYSTGPWYFQSGIYSNDTPTTTNGTGDFGDGEFGDFSGGASFGLGAGYDFAKTLGTDKALLRADWIHSERETGDFVLGRYDDLVSTTFIVKKDAAQLVIEGFFGSGGDGANSDVFGFYIQSTYDILPDQLQLVGRCSFSNSDGPLGVLGQSRYERKVADNGGRGDTYRSLYGGIQYFINGDNLKLLAGVDWAQLEGSSEAYDGTTFLTGVRFAF